MSLSRPSGPLNRGDPCDIRGTVLAMQLDCRSIRTSRRAVWHIGPSLMSNECEFLDETEGPVQWAEIDYGCRLKMSGDPESKYRV
jgi:hypothetical protein